LERRGDRVTHQSVKWVEYGGGAGDLAKSIRKRVEGEPIVHPRVLVGVFHKNMTTMTKIVESPWNQFEAFMRH
jgi:hypothetical protein